RTALRTVGAWYGALSGHDEVVALAALSQVPVRVLVGERDLLTPPGEARFIAERLSADAVLDVMPDAGHMLPMERPQQVADHLTDLVEGAR
ncbi:MAG: alpha/beta fold hydrolase, partial [Actinomycetes bacterium]